jgi:hypothetical protein
MLLGCNWQEIAVNQVFSFKPVHSAIARPCGFLCRGLIWGSLKYKKVARKKFRSKEMQFSPDFS